jgi:CheY-like chemotaxis protein
MPKKILLADDSITIQKVVELTFSDGDYEVTAVNNGAKAVLKLAEMRPDIILSDIIMPEKNGYEVCEYVKSHPDFRNIPVILLTGTFEPFDPDRAEKAGCDAVVTKPFESQSLIHKVEELIAQAHSNASAAASAPPAPEPEPASPWLDETAATAPEPPSVEFSTTAFTHDPDIFGAAPAPDATTEMPFELPAAQDEPVSSQAESFAEPADQFSGGETRAFPRMSFDELQQLSSPPPPAPEPEPPAVAPEPSPWDEPLETGGETRAFTKMSFDDFAAPAPAAAPPAENDSPFGAPPPAEEFSGETRAFPRMSFEELQQLAAAETPAAPPPAFDPAPATPAELSPWDEPETPAFGGETRAFPKLSFDELQQTAAPAPEPETASWEAPPASASPFGDEAEAPAFGGETRAFPKLSFDDFQQMTPEPEPQPAASSSWDEPQQAEAPSWSEPEAPLFGEPQEASPFDTPAASPFDASASPFAAAEEPAPGYDEPEAPAGEWSSPAIEASTNFEPPTFEPPTFEPAAFEPPTFDAPSTLPFGEEAEPPVALSDQAVPEDMPFATEVPEEEEAPAAIEAAPGEAAFEEAEAVAEPDEPVTPPAALAPEAPPMPIAARGSDVSSDLTDEQVDRIARRVVELMSESVVRNIAWEVIPDLAEMVVKERIRQLEAE